MSAREEVRNRKRIVIKIGSSSLMHKDTGRLNLRKIEQLVRTLVDLKNSGKRCYSCIFRCDSSRKNSHRITRKAG